MSDAPVDATPGEQRLTMSNPPSSMSQEELDALTAEIVKALKTVWRPGDPGRHL